MTDPQPKSEPLPTFSVLGEYGATNLDAYRPTSTAAQRAMGAPRALVEAQAVVLGLCDIKPVGETLLGWTFRAKQEAMGRAAELWVGPPPLRTPSPPPLFRLAAKLVRLEGLDVPRVFGCGKLPPEGTSYLLGEAVAGVGLDQLQREWAGAAPADGLSELVRRFAAAATTLAAAHQRGVVHGDLTPRCLRFVAADRVVVVDWSGLERLPHPGEAPDRFGLTETLDYRHPESLLPGATSSAAGDVWALLAVLYRAVTGVAPLAHHGDVRHRLQALAQPATPPMRDPAEVAPRVPAALAELLRLGLLAPPPARLQDAAALARALRGVCESLAGTR